MMDQKECKGTTGFQSIDNREDPDTTFSSYWLKFSPTVGSMAHSRAACFSEMDFFQAIILSCLL